jgi:transposase
MSVDRRSSRSRVTQRRSDVDDMKPTGGGINHQPVGAMHANAQKQIVDTASAKVEVIKLGQDLHARHVVVAVQLDGCPPQPAQRIATERYIGWIEQLKTKYPQAQIHACYEAGPCGYWLHRRLLQVGVKSHVVAPVALNGRRKNDKRDARALCDQLDRFVRGNERAFSAVTVPTPTQEQDRAVVRHRQALIKSLGRVAHQGRSLMLLEGVRAAGKWWSKRTWSQWRTSVPAWQVPILEDFVAQAQQLQAQIQAQDKRITELAEERKITAPRGLGVRTLLTLLLEVIDWHRFKNRRQVGSYTGLCPGEDSSGERRRELSIDKHGNRRVRHMLIEAAWRLTIWQPDYPPLQRLHAAQGARARKRAIVAIARRLAIDLWRLATGQTTREKVGLAAMSTTVAAA